MAQGTVRALVVGESMLDSWLRGSARRLAQEAPVPVVNVDEVDDAPGGAGNAAANLAALGAQVRLLSAVGADSTADTLTRALELCGVTTDLVVVPGRRTARKVRLLAGEQLIARFDQEDRRPIPAWAERELAARLTAALPQADVVVVCDYAAGLFTPYLRRAAADAAMLVVDARQVAAWRACRPTVVLPNYTETLSLLGEPDVGPDRVGFLLSQTAAIVRAAGAEMVVTTLDCDGALLHRAGREPYRTSTEPVPSHMTAGAGDTLTAAFALRLAEGATPEQAADAAQAAAAVAVRRSGTAVCTRPELRAALRQREGSVQPPELLARRLDEHRRRGRRIVFTNGCFDVLHLGHVTYLEQARRLGDVLVVAVNSDASVARLKGLGRPINPCDDRMGVLAALNQVDYVTWFDQDTPERLIRMIRPDVYVKGGDYTPEMLPEAAVVRALGGQVRILDYVPDRSTTAVLGRIRHPAVDLPQDHRR